MITETLEQKVARLEREKKEAERRAEEAEAEGAIIGWTLGRATGRATRMYGAGMITGDL
jgi:hypothetical protein